MRIFTFCFILLILLFIMIFSYQILNNHNKIIGYQTIKDFNESDFNMIHLNKKYHRSTCDDYCDSDICNDYDIQMDKFHSCVSCSKKLKCYNVFTNTCENCISLGMGQCNMPINPRNNFCKNS